MPASMLKTVSPTLPRHVTMPLTTALPVGELAVGADGTTVGVAEVGKGGCAVMFEMVSITKEL